MAIQIDHNIPAPFPREREASKYPWKTMEIGDSFLFPESIDSKNSYNRAWIASRAYGRKFISRKVDGRMRCWRIA